MKITINHNNKDVTIDVQEFAEKLSTSYKIVLMGFIYNSLHPCVQRSFVKRCIWDMPEAFLLDELNRRKTKNGSIGTKR